MFDRARTRYLTALGLEGVALATLGACHATPAAPPEPATTIVITSPTASDSATTAPAPATSTSTTPAQGKLVTTTGETILDACPEPSGISSGGWDHPSRRLPTCPHGDYCVDAPASAGSSAAPAPYSMCADKIGPPSQVGFPGAPKAHSYFSPEGTEAQRACHPNACCYRWSIPCPGGRALRSNEDEAIATPIAARADWCGTPRDGDAAISVGDLPSHVRAALARRWQREASFEHASIASFARASLELLALGAPPDLVLATHAAAIDEIRHAEIAYEIASAYGERAVGPARLPAAALTVHAPTFATFALATFRDACVGETIASLEARAGRDLATNPGIIAALETIASDEERHAELAWRTLAWALDVGGAPAIEAVSAAVRELERSLLHAVAIDSDEIDLAPHGMLGAIAAARLRARAITDVVLPCVHALLAAREPLKLRDATEPRILESCRHANG